MNGYFLLVIGFICIFVSIIFIFKSDSIMKLQYEETVKKQQQISEYIGTIEKLIEDLDILISKSLKNIDLLDNNNQDNLAISNNNKFNINSVDINNLTNVEGNRISENHHSEIITLKKMGYKNDVIAKKLNKGVREIDIILKMNGFRD